MATRVGVSILVSFLLSAPAAAQSIPTAGLRLWLDGDRGIQATGGRVDTWLDQSGQGNHAQSAGSLRPTVDGATLGFDGSQQMTVSLGAGPLTQASVFTVARYTVASSDNDYLYSIGNRGSSGSQITASRRNGNRPYHFDGSVQNVSSTTVIEQCSWRAFSQVVGDGTPTAHRWSDQGGALITSNARAGYSAVPNMVIANFTSGSFRFIGDLAEVLVYDRVLSPAEEATVRAHIETRAARLEFGAGFPPAVSAPRDLATWTVEQYQVGCQPAANWTVGMDPTTVTQPVNADPSIFLSDIECLDADIRVDCLPGTGPDYAGFVFGYQDRGHYYLFAWRRSTLNWGCGGGVADVGATLRIVDAGPGGEPTGPQLWLAANSPSTTQLRQASIPWNLGTTYTMRLVFQRGQFRIQVADPACGTGPLIDWDVADSTYQSGRYGFWLHSQEGSRFGNVTVDGVQTVPGCGAPGTMPTLRAATPFAGSVWPLRVRGVSPATPGAILASAKPFSTIDLGNGCFFGLDLATNGVLVAFLSNANGDATVDLPLAPTVPIAGIGIALQGFAAPTAGPFGGDLTSAVVVQGH